MMKVLFSFVALSSGLALAQQTPPPAKPAAAKPAAAKPAAVKPAAVKPAAAAVKPAAAKPVAPPKPAEPAREPGVYAYFDIVQASGAAAAPMGRIVVRLHEKESPITVKNFIDLATGLKLWVDPKTQPYRKVKRPLYNGLTFHRVIPGFMIQGGDPQGNGMGGTDAIPDEFHPSLMFDKPYILAMANAGPNTGSSQFFITTGPGPMGFPQHLNGRHTIFGQVVEGQEVVEAVARVPRGEADRPNTAVVMKTVTIRRFGAAAAPAKPAAVKPAAAKPAASKPAVPAKK
jgi:peptidyl-prolyl cis-trans isomerase A (cyclophilin A)